MRLLKSRIENIEFYLSHDHGDLTPIEESVLPLSSLSRSRIKRHNERIAEFQKINQEYEAKKARVEEIGVQTRRSRGTDREVTCTTPAINQIGLATGLGCFRDECEQ